MTGSVEVREEVTPAGPFRLPRRNGMDGLLRRRGRVLERLLHDGEQPVLVRVAQPAGDRVLFGARAASREAALHGIARMRFALGVDEDLSPFLRRFAGDELIGRSLRRRPWLRVSRRPEPFEALGRLERRAQPARRLPSGGGPGGHLAGPAAIAGPRRRASAGARAGRPRGRPRAHRPA